MNKDYDLDLIEYKVKEKFNRMMNDIYSIRALKEQGTAPQILERVEMHLGADLASSIQAAATLVDPDDLPRYQYKKGSCYFVLDGVTFIVADLRDMRGDHCFFDVCCVLIDYVKDDEEGTSTYEFVPDAWLYGSTSDEFDEYHEVHPEFINKCRKFIEEHGGAEYLREMQKDEEE